MSADFEDRNRSARPESDSVPPADATDGTGGGGERSSLSSDDLGDWLVYTASGTIYFVRLSDTPTIERLPDPGNPASDWVASYLNAPMDIVEMHPAVLGERWYFVRSSPDPRITSTPWIRTSPIVAIRPLRGRQEQAWAFGVA